MAGPVLATRFYANGSELTVLCNSGPQLFWGQFLWKTIFPWTGRGGIILGRFKCVTFIVHFISVINIFYYYYISSTADHQALNPRDWGLLLYRTDE